MSVLQTLASPSQRNLSALGHALDQTSISSSSALSSSASSVATTLSSSTLSSSAASMTAPAASSSIAVPHIKIEFKQQPQGREGLNASFQPMLTAGKSPKKRERNESFRKPLSNQPASQRHKSSPSSSSSSTGGTPRNDSKNNVLLPSKDRSGRFIQDKVTMLKQTPPAKEKSNPRRWSKAEDESLRLAVERSGERNWKAIADQVPGRNHTQCLQRWTKVLKPGLIKGHWTPEEDAKLKELVAEGKKNWGQVASLIPGRTSKQCRERWCNHLDPNINKGTYTREEDRIILEMQAKLGNRWSIIAQQLKGRTEDAVKIRWKSLMRGKRGSPSSREDSQGSDSSNKTPRVSRNRSGSTPSKHQKTASPSRLPALSPAASAQAHLNSSKPTINSSPMGSIPATASPSSSASQARAPSSVASATNPPAQPPPPPPPSMPMLSAVTYPSMPSIVNDPQPSANRPQLNTSMTGHPPPHHHGGYANMAAFSMSFQPGNPLLVSTTAASYGNTTAEYPTTTSAPPFNSMANPAAYANVIGPGQQYNTMHGPVFISNGRPISLAATQGFPVPGIQTMNYPVYPVLGGAPPGSNNGVPVQPAIPLHMIASTTTTAAATTTTGTTVPLPLQHPIVAALREEPGSRVLTPREEWGSHSTPQPQMPLADGHTSGYELFHQQRLRLIMKERERQELALSSAPSPGQAMLTKELQANKERQKRQAIMQKGWKSAVEAMMSFSDPSAQEEQQRFDGGMLEKVGLSTLDPTDDDLIGNTVDDVGTAEAEETAEPETTTTTTTTTACASTNTSTTNSSGATVAIVKANVEA